MLQDIEVFAIDVIATYRVGSFPYSHQARLQLLPAKLLTVHLEHDVQQTVIL
jgi:hypothetical protein